MNLLKSLTIAVVVMATALTGCKMLDAQTTQNVGATTTNTQKKVAFRAINWQHKHIHDTGAAEKLVASLEKIGCEVNQFDHDGHLDVKYRCATWKSITVENEAFQKEWAEWLATQGLETIVIDPPAEPGLELVRFRRPEWHNVHMEDATKAGQLMATLKMIGCDADQHEHDGHVDVRFRCNDWKSIALQNHASAMSWQKWLNNLEFETEHTH